MLEAFWCSYSSSVNLYFSLLFLRNLLENRDWWRSELNIFGAHGWDGGWAHGSGQPALWELCPGIHLQRDSAGLQHPVPTAGAGPSGLQQLLQLPEGCSQLLEGQSPVGQTGQTGPAEGLQPEQSLPRHQGENVYQMNDVLWHAAVPSNNSPHVSSSFCSGDRVTCLLSSQVIFLVCSPTRTKQNSVKYHIAASKFSYS